MPVAFLLEYLEGGDTIEEFLDGFPTVTRAQVIAYLEEVRDLALAGLREIAA